MGRRALRKLDPALDLTGFLYSYEELPERLELVPFFGREAPVQIEVGSGKGLFLQSACESLPDQSFLGIELAKKYARHCAGRLAKGELRNGKVIAGDAIRVFTEKLSAGCAAAVHVYFPDPWWKKRHQKRRVMSEVFIHQIARVLADDGQLHFWTDVEEYFAITLATIATVEALRGPEPENERPAAHDLDYRTHFERRMRIQGQPVYRAVFRRVGR